MSEACGFMVRTTDLAEIGALVGDPGRANMLAALLDGRALTASELAEVGGVTPQTASGHLARLSAAGLLAVTRQGRHRYHRLASTEVAHMLEAIMQVAASAVRARPARRTGPRDETLRRARTCYDHLAGRLGVALCDALVAAEGVELDEVQGRVTETGALLLGGFGVDVSALKPGGRPVCRVCIDWSERRPHLAGAVGAAIMARSFELGWLRRLPGTRAVQITPAGSEGFRRSFGVRPS